MSKLEKYGRFLLIEQGECAPQCSHIEKNGIQCRKPAVMNAYGMIDNDGKRQKPAPMCFEHFDKWFGQEKQLDNLL